MEKSINLEKFLEAAREHPEAANQILNSIFYDTGNGVSALEMLSDDVMDDPNHHGINAEELNTFLSEVCVDKELELIPKVVFHAVNDEGAVAEGVWVWASSPWEAFAKANGAYPELITAAARNDGDIFLTKIDTESNQTMFYKYHEHEWMLQSNETIVK